MNQEVNPFQPPEADIEPVHSGEDSGALASEPRSVPAGNGVQWISDGWNIYKPHFGLWIGMLVVTGAIFMVASMLPLIGMLSGWLFPMFLGGWMIGCRRVHTEGELRFEDLFAGFSEHLQPLAIASLVYLGGNIVAMIAAAFIAVILGGSAAFLFTADASTAAGAMGLAIVLGLLVFMALLMPILMMIWFAPALIVFNRIEPIQALKLSFIGCLRNIVPFLLYGLVGMAMLIIGAIPLFLGWLVVYPVLMCAVYPAYRDIFLEENPV